LEFKSGENIMAMRSVWKGSISFLLVTIPVKLFNAVDASEKIKFNWLHEGCLGRVGMEKRCKKCAEVLKPEQIVNGFEFEPDRYAIIGDEELKQVKIKSTKSIEIVGFVDPAAVPKAAYSDSYYAGADGFPAEKPYALLRDGMNDTGKVAIGRVVLRDREEVVTVEPVGSGLLIKRLHFANEVRSIAEVPGASSAVQVDERESALAQQLINQMLIDFSGVDQTDHYRESLKQVIDAKIKGKAVTVAADDTAAKRPTDVMSALAASLEAMKKTTPTKLELVKGDGGQSTGKVERKVSAKKKKAA
jgi:DNA end-binding protein Ku